MKPTSDVAEEAGRGVCRGSFVEPRLYQVCHRAKGRSADCSDDANTHPLAASLNNGDDQHPLGREKQITFGAMWRLGCVGIHVDCLARGNWKQIGRELPI
jgi:hypothetical protein